MKYPVVLSLEEIDTILDALADYGYEYYSEWDTDEDDSFTELRMTVAAARKELSRRQREVVRDVDITQ